jgi:hypothetical protein
MSKFVPGGKFPNSRLAFVTTLFILLEGEHRILSLINIGTVRTLAENNKKEDVIGEWL